MNLDWRADQYRRGVQQGVRIRQQIIKRTRPDICSGQTRGIDAHQPVCGQLVQRVLGCQKLIHGLVEGGHNLLADPVVFEPGIACRADKGCRELLAAHSQIFGDGCDRIIQVNIRWQRDQRCACLDNIITEKARWR